MRNESHVLMFLCMELKEFLRAATKRERAEIAVVCNDSVPYLYQLAGGCLLYTSDAADDRK